MRRCLLEHTIRANQRLFPGFATEESGIVYQVHRSGDKLVDVLDGDLSRRLFIYSHCHRIPAVVGMAAQGSQKVAHAAFSRNDAIFKAKALGIMA
jgi:hypothetical protein